MAQSDSVLFRKGPALGVAVLNRPTALNSLNASMIELLRRRYEVWQDDSEVHAILIKGVGSKAFCAGGDVKQTVLNMRAGRPEHAKGFFRQEYRLNHFISTLKKPHIALLDGICMGGGAGVSIHGTFRIATERSVFAMPECGIGLVPDVGASHFLSSLQGELGTYLALTGTRLKGYQLVEAGLATHLVSSSKLGHLEERMQLLGLGAGDLLQLETLFSSLQVESREHTKPSGLLEDLPEIRECFAHSSVEAIAAALEGRRAAWAKAALKQLASSSPLSQKLALREMREGAGCSLADCLRMEFRLASHIVDGPSDFDEGIRALLIDKDGKPSWKPPRLDQVSGRMVDAFFAALPPEEELHFSPEGGPASKL